MEVAFKSALWSLGYDPILFLSASLHSIIKEIFQAHFLLIFVHGQESAISSETVTAISLLLSCSESIVSAPLCNIGAGLCKHTSFARWHLANFDSRGRWRDTAGKLLGAGECPLFSLLLWSSCQWGDVYAEHSVVLTLWLVLLAPGRQFPAPQSRPTVSCLPASIYWHSSREVTYSICQLQLTSYGPAPTQDNSKLLCHLLACSYTLASEV